MKTLTLCLACLPLSAGDWTKADSLRQGAVLAAFYADYTQTCQIARSPHLRELNPILGPHPSRTAIDRYFITGAALHTAIAYFLPTDARRKWQNGTIAIEIGFIAHNQFNLDVRVRL